ncbi:AAA family ATPase [Runella sp. MFBS21]|uniref:AAA family ATPase n=1 Tax=Runella sp. MFBS21 TaxID=3034018 RepID=UPI0023F85894|nr:AAA family ATPase [Runella sp. MFBS21]MDF7819407.1 AAA family ATPase [Runella sp. MFBS21]
MKIQRIHIKNFKSIVDLEINEPNPFTVFVGPNGSGKSNIFEALEFFSMSHKYNDTTIELFRGADSFINFNSLEKEIQIILHLDVEYITKCNLYIDKYTISTHTGGRNYRYNDAYKSNEYEQFVKKFCRVFINNTKSEKISLNSDSFLSTSASNLEKVLKRILQDDEKKQEISEWLNLFIPGFERVEIVSSELSSTDTLVMYEKGVQKPFTKDLLSDGTYNILALLTAVYQSDQPQFLCIEEPENGLNPYVVRKLVDFFRDACENKGHYIWLNTHSGTLVDCLTPEEVILVDKVGGQTQIKQLKGLNLHGLDMAEAWLSGALGGGTPW